MAVTKNQLQLGQMLSALREARGLSQREVEAGTKRAINKSSLSNLENARGPVTSWPTCQILAEFYGADEATTARIVYLAQHATDRGDWEDYSGFSEFALFVSLEADADELVIFDPEIVTGLLQTPEYARAVLAAGDELTEDEIAKALAVRTRRTERVLRPGGPLVTWITTEGALRRVVGGADTHRCQIDHLMFPPSDRVTIEVIREDSGAYAGLRGGYTLLRFGQGTYLNDTAYIESIDGCRYIDDPDKLELYNSNTRALRRVARPLAEVYEDVAQVVPKRNQRRAVRRSSQAHD